MRTIFEDIVMIIGLTILFVGVPIGVVVLVAESVFLQ